MRILIFIGHYLPGTRVGGPLRSTAALIERLKYHDFYVFTSNTDFGLNTPLSGIEVDEWTQRGRANIFYASSAKRTLKALRQIIRNVSPDIIYLHGFFARRFTLPVLILIRLKFLPELPVVVAPRGEFAASALNIKRWRKLAFTQTAALLGLYHGVTWHAASEAEAIDIRRARGSAARVVIAPNFSATPLLSDGTKHDPKQEGMCRLVFLARINRMKNLEGALAALRYVCCQVNFDIYGPIEDVGYWHACKAAMAELPENVRVTYLGELPPAKCQETLVRYDALFLPTLGENFGHAIVESWAAATPTLISDRTPWRDLEADYSGWAIPPDDLTGLAKCVDMLARMDNETHAVWRAGALAYAKRINTDKSIVSAYDKLFSVASPSEITT